MGVDEKLCSGCAESRELLLHRAYAGHQLRQRSKSCAPDLNRPLISLKSDRALFQDPFRGRIFRKQIECALAHGEIEADFLGGGFHPESSVDSVAYGGEIVDVARTRIADRRMTGVDPGTDAERCGQAEPLLEFRADALKLG